MYTSYIKIQQCTMIAFYSIASIYSCFCSGCDINMHWRRVPTVSCFFYATQAALRKRKPDSLADGLRRLHRNYPSERRAASGLRNVKPLSRSLFHRDIDLRDRTTYVIFGSCQWRDLHINRRNVACVIHSSNIIQLLGNVHVAC